MRTLRNFKKNKKIGTKRRRYRNTRYKRKFGGSTSSSMLYKVYSLNVLDPAVATKFTIEKIKDNDDDERKDYDAPTIENEDEFNKKRLNELSALLKEKMDDGYIILLQEVSDLFVDVLFPGNIDGDEPTKNEFSLITKKTEKYSFVYCRSFKMAANAQQGLLIGCKNIMNMDLMSAKKANKACSVEINGVTYVTAHFPGGPPGRNTGNTNYINKLIESKLLDSENCVFTCDMNQNPSLFSPELNHERFVLCNNGTELTTCGINFYMPSDKTYTYAPPDYIDGIWFRGEQSPYNVKIDTLNNCSKYYSDHKALVGNLIKPTNARPLRGARFGR